MSFSAGMIGTNKREVREKLYDDVRALLKSPTRFAMLAGGAPSEEIDCIRRRFFRPQIVAFDLAQSCVDAAVSCGIEGVMGNVAFTTVMAGRTFDVFDLDLCRTVKTSEHAIRAAAQATTGALAIFVSYRDNAIQPETTILAERASALETTNAAERASALETTNAAERAAESETTTSEERASGCETTKDEERANSSETTTHGERAKSVKTTISDERASEVETTKGAKITDAQQSRINDALRVIREVRPNAQLRRCYAYKGNALNMIGLLVYFGRKQIETLPPFCPHREEESHARRYRLRTLGVGGEKLEKRIRAGARGARG